MMRRLILILLCAGTVTFTISRECAATDVFAKVSTSGARILSFTQGPRNIAMGHIGVADDSDPLNQFYNPANLVGLGGVSVSQGFVDWPFDIDFYDTGAAGGFAVDGTRFQMAASVRFTRMSVTAQPGRTIFLPGNASRSLELDDWYLTLATAAGVRGEHVDFAVGAAVKPTRLGILDGRTTAWAFDLGALIKLKMRHESGFRVVPSLGVSVLNFGNDARIGLMFSDLPQEFRAGLGIRLEAPPSQLIEKRFGHRVPLGTISALIEYVEHVTEMNSSEGRDGVGFGVEIGLVDVVFGRLGYSDTVGAANKKLSYGGGLAWQLWGVRLAFDYARYDRSTSFFPDFDIEVFGASAEYSF